MSWVESLEELSLFENWINSIHPSLKFTFKRSIEGVEFLDLFVYTSNNRIHTKMYSKQSDTHSYLEYTKFMSQVSHYKEHTF